ncbi:DUF1540 domain-containing protein [Buchananella hordeovulneris]|uniref:DUF1540 domain-containing protein n=1 Tax=Buchananella hordeovulneris TaxID=52770 RepID=A0A1Q5PTE4_9ACTO|nr:DUF1540 domain-containing protein [Buchananella hordeovulneris]MDO5080669.1 DUF1540 domain-containing protein [Buchananella hordeovulneris]OKL50843.1 hypothetical protein BSZ40_10440 [Buchananella hordeovulneris]RRD42983.1 DUF1540 domain-containing protein [Buchananella hordeovulneris]RRD51044.1 DUF1540 domain-containing protein [Buchananella hordeovulneris]
MTALTAVTGCAASTCAFNNDGCTAPAITVAGQDASCTTFIALNTRGGLPIAQAHVGVCKRSDCTHNDHLMCTADQITLNGSTATCASFTER